MDTLRYKVIVQDNILAQKVFIEKRLIVHESQVSPYPSMVSTKLYETISISFNKLLARYLECVTYEF